MSRFDRRLKGKRLRESTCALEGVPKARFDGIWIGNKHHKFYKSNAK